MNGSKMYKRLTGGFKNQVWYALFVVLTAALMWGAVFVIVMQDNIKPHGRDSGDWTLGIIIPSVAAGAVIWVDMIFVKKWLKQLQQRKKRLEAMTESEFLELDRQVKESEFYYKTFYYLDEYFYVPRMRLLIKYDDILSGEIKERYGAGEDIGTPRLCGAWLVITDKDGVVYEIKVKKWRQFLAKGFNVKAWQSR